MISLWGRRAGLGYDLTDGVSIDVYSTDGGSTDGDSTGYSDIASGFAAFLKAAVEDLNNAA